MRLITILGAISSSCSTYTGCHDNEENKHYIKSKVTAPPHRLVIHSLTDFLSGAQATCHYLNHHTVRDSSSAVAVALATITSKSRLLKEAFHAGYFGSSTGVGVLHSRYKGVTWRYRKKQKHVPLDENASVHEEPARLTDRITFFHSAAHKHHAEQQSDWVHTSL